jgi:hypothetical protein
MTAKKFELEFVGYRLEAGLKSWPEKSGIYCVYRCVSHPKDNQVSLEKLIYIGEAGDLRKRMSSHEKFDVWESCLKDGEVLCFSYALVSGVDRERCEAAMIYEHQPIKNEHCKDSFSHDETTISLSGDIKWLTANFTVKKTV